MEKFSISRDENLYLAWPSLVKLKNDHLFCIYTSCNHHNQRDNSSLKVVRSTNRGRSWSEPEAFTEVTDITNYYNNARVQRLGNSIVIVCDKVYGNELAEIPADVYMWISDDEAQTFTQPIKIPACGIVPDIKQLKNGNWILTAHRTIGDIGKLVQFAWISEDRGKTWSDEIIVGKSDKYNLCEASVLECTDGTLVSYMRENSGKGYDGIKTMSKDGGYTWEGIYDTAIQGCHRPTIGHLNDGRVLVTYRYLPNPQALYTFVALTDEESCLKTCRDEQWVRVKELDFDRNKQQDCGYTDWVQFDDGEIYIVNYIKDDWNKGQIRGYSIHPSEMIFD